MANYQDLDDAAAQMRSREAAVNADRETAAIAAAPDRALCIDTYCDSCHWCVANGKCAREVRRMIAAFTPPASDAAVPAGEVERLRHKMWMIACHATGGGMPEVEGIDQSINDISVQITASRNLVYQAGIEAGRKEAVAAPKFTVPTGFALVPIKPTEAMRDAGVLDVRAEVSYEDACDIWSAMIAAAPKVASSISLYREIDALGGTGEGEWHKGYTEALTEVLAILSKRGFAE